MNRSALLVCIIFLLVPACSSWADDFVDARFFLDQKVVATGLGGTPWEKSFSFDEERSRAWMDALHHAYEHILDLPLMEGKLVRNVLQTNEELKDRLNPVLLGAPRFFYKPDTSGLVRCRIEVPMSGKNSLRSALYLASLRPQPQEPTAFNQSWRSGAYADKKNGEENGDELPFRRLIIDARAYRFEPSLFPRFFDASGNLLFQESMISGPSRFSRPMVIYADDIRTARKNYTEEDSYTIVARVSPLALRDITVAGGDVEILARFVGGLKRNPLQEKDIIVVFDPLRAGKKGKLAPDKTREEGKDKKSQEAVR